MLIPRSIELTPIRCRRRFERFALSSVIKAELRRNRVRIRNGDILVVSSKFVAVSEGQFVELSGVRPNGRARKIARQYKMSPSLVQLVVNESESILGGIPGFLLALTGGVLAPNAGIDLSNAPKGWAILYPKNPKRSAQRLRRNLLSMVDQKIDKLGIILSDSRVTPTRIGTVGVAVASAGIRPTVDTRGERDLFGNTLKVTLRGLADQVSTAAEICMGEARESTPIVLVRGVAQAFERPRTKFEKLMTISPKECLIIAGLKNENKN
jgi:coenzyme F420-0:L-glutamate ligase